jgi:hypothetical protein
MVRGLDPILFAGLFLLSTFIAAAVVGLAAFAFGLVASGIWLYILSPVLTATIILAFGFPGAELRGVGAARRARLAAHLAARRSTSRSASRSWRPPIPRICVSA